MAEDVYKQIRMVGLLFLAPLVLGLWPLAGYFIGDYLRQQFGYPVYFPADCKA